MENNKIYEDILKIIKSSLHGTDTTEQHLTTLFGIAVTIRCKRILELGVLYGKSTFPLLLASYFTKGKLVSIDKNNTTFVPPNYLLPYWNFVQSDSLKFLEESIENNEKYDLIFVDDWHAYDHVKKELSLISQLIDINSVVLMHDLMHSGSHPYYSTDSEGGHPGEWQGGGPYLAVKELPKYKWEFSTIPVCHGLTILRKLQ